MSRSAIRSRWQILSRILFWLALFVAAPASFGAERFPPPQFDSAYTMPATSTPLPRAQWLEWLDLAVLIGALSVSTYCVLKKRSRKAIFGVMLFSLLYFGFYRQGCICAIGSIQDVSLALFNGGYAVPLTVLAFFLLPLIFTLFFGRTFCAGVCPLGALQDLFLIKPVALPAWLEKGLSIVPFLYLGAAVFLAALGARFLICEFDPFVAFFRRSGSFGMLVAGGALLLLGVVVGRPYCRFLCPYGALLSCFSRFSKWNVTLTPQDCLHCQICEVACPFGAIREPTPAPAPRPGLTRRVIALAFLTAALVALGIWFGSRTSTVFAQLHPTVALAERFAAEETGRVQGEIDATKAFRQSARPAQELYGAALDLRRRFGLGGWLLGAFAGLVVAMKFGTILFPAPHTVYEPDRANCVGCGRCYSYCPKEISRQKKFPGKNVIPLTPV